MLNCGNIMQIIRIIDAKITKITQVGRVRRVQSFTIGTGTVLYIVLVELYSVILMELVMCRSTPLIVPCYLLFHPFSCWVFCFYPLCLGFFLFGQRLVCNDYTYLLLCRGFLTRLRLSFISKNDIIYITF